MLHSQAVLLQANVLRAVVNVDAAVLGAEPHGRLARRLHLVTRCDAKHQLVVINSSHFHIGAAHEHRASGLWLKISRCQLLDVLASSAGELAGHLFDAAESSSPVSSSSDVSELDSLLYNGKTAHCLTLAGRKALVRYLSSWNLALDAGFVSLDVLPDGGDPSHLCVSFFVRYVLASDLGRRNN